MSKNFTICVRSVGAGLWRSENGGNSFARVTSIWGQSSVYALAVHPNDPATIYAGANDGLYLSHDRGKSFEETGFPIDGMSIRKIAIDPVDPDTIFVGTMPSGLYRTKDGGKQWEKLSVELATECAAVRIPRITGLTVDPTDHRNVWAGVEVDGARRSTDGGDTWTYVQGGLPDPDIHDVVVSAADPKTVIISTPKEIYTSTDTGETWTGLGVAGQFALPYCRTLALKANDPNTMFVASGDAAVGSTGTIHRTTDRGKSWEQLTLPVAPNTPMWVFATHPADPDLVLACSHYGEIYATPDGGDWWVKLGREVTEIWGIAWTPN